MRDKHQRSAARDQESFHPLDRIDIKVIGRFVQQQHIRLSHQRTRQQRLSLATARRLGERHVGIERQVLQHRLDPRVNLPRIGGVDRVMQTIKRAQGDRVV